MSRELMTWSLRSLSSSSQILVQTWVPSWTSYCALFSLWSICFPKSTASGHILLKKGSGFRIHSWTCFLYISLEFISWDGYRSHLKTQCFATRMAKLTYFCSTINRWFDALSEVLLGIILNLALLTQAFICSAGISDYIRPPGFNSSCHIFNRQKFMGPAEEAGWCQVPGSCGDMKWAKESSRT